MPRLISTKDTGNTATWIADDLKLIEDRRKVSQLLTHDTLPATGMSMEYHVVTSDTTAVGKQETEGSELSFGKVTFGTKTADINTYGGYTSLSRQTIERSTTPMLNTAITALQKLTRRPPRRQCATICTRRSRRSATHPLTPTRSTRHSWPT